MTDITYRVEGDYLIPELILDRERHFHKWISDSSRNKDKDS